MASAGGFWIQSLLAACLLGVLEMAFMADARARSEACPPGTQSVGDKWFDGCQWCVCTARGPLCSRSGCSTGLVAEVAPCHEPGQRWVDGCYKCRCKRHGITCRMDVTCLRLGHRPVPCLTDKRCVCGPDGVPSCTAEVIDRHAFSARRVDLGIPALLNPASDESSGGDLASSPVADVSSDLESLSTSLQELLITSDNLCRFGPRWYGGSLRCFCDMDGGITCGNPTFVSAFFDDFKVRREGCEEGHAWEEGCSVCSCRINGVVFCRRDRKCRRQLLDHEADLDEDLDHYLPGFHDQLEEETSISGFHDHHEEETGLPAPQLPAANPSRSGKQCAPRTEWKIGCQHCRCSDDAVVVCHRRHCRTTTLHQRHKDNQSGTGQRENVAHQPPGFSRRGPRGPMMVVPRPPSIMRPPAYARHKGVHGIHGHRACGRFRVGQKWWDECNLCLCTRRGPKCQGKLCR